jgi:DNA-binding PadR family transcriptional regulator
MSRRFFRHGELPLVLLALLDDRPMHGYEVMSELSRLFGPAYRPSPGTVYPAVDALEAEGLIDGDARNGRTTYRTTEAGAEALRERADALAALEVRTGARVRRSDSLEPALERFKARVAPLSGLVDAEAVAAVLDRAAAEIESLEGLTTKETRR